MSGSPYTVTVYPGEVDPAQCYTDLSGSLTSMAGVAFTFKIQFVDLWGNLHYLTMTDDIAAGLSVACRADYVNHDNWPSSIDVDDSPANW